MQSQHFTHLYICLCRREVKAIEKCQDGTFKIEARHWEPSSYLEAVPQAGGADGADLAMHIMISVAFGFLAAALITDVLVPERYLREHQAELYSQLQTLVPVQNAYKRVVFPVIVLLVAVLYNLISPPTRGKISKSASSDGSASASVGAGGRQVTVDEIKLGGSGSASVMQGQTVGTETVFARYVVNAAGNYSDKIANMIGDDSFSITPRLGNYLLLHRNQVSAAVCTGHIYSQM
jgi:hypothetical protein